MTDLDPHTPETEKAPRIEAQSATPHQIRPERRTSEPSCGSRRTKPKGTQEKRGGEARKTKTGVLSPRRTKAPETVHTPQIDPQRHPDPHPHTQPNTPRKQKTDPRRSRSNAVGVS